MSSASAGAARQEPRDHGRGLSFGGRLMRGSYRSIYAVLLDSPEYRGLSANARLLLLTVKISLGPSGIGVLFEDQLRERSGLQAAAVAKARQELVAADFLRVEAGVYWLRNGLRFEPTMSLANPKHRKGIATYLEGLPRLSIVREFRAYYGIEPHENGRRP